jgi:hypothetical protein
MLGNMNKQTVTQNLSQKLASEQGNVLTHQMLLHIIMYSLEVQQRILQ